MSKTVQAEKATERETKTAAEIKAGDMVLGGAFDMDLGGLVVEVLSAHPFLYCEAEPMTLLVTKVAGDDPEPCRLKADAVLEMATEHEIADAKDRARQYELCQQLRAMAGLIEDKQLPLPRMSTYGSGFVHLDVHFGDNQADLVDEVAGKLGIEAKSSHLMRRAHWSPGGDLGLQVNWHGYLPEPKPEAADPNDGRTTAALPPKPDTLLVATGDPKRAAKADVR